MIEVIQRHIMKETGWSESDVDGGRRIWEADLPAMWFNASLSELATKG